MKFGQVIQYRRLKFVIKFKYEKAGQQNLQRKWDNYNYRNEHERKIVEEAKLYYFTRHLPFRNFKTSILAIIHIFKMKDFASIRRALVIFRETCKSSYHAINRTIKSSSFLG